MVSIANQPGGLYCNLVRRDKKGTEREMQRGVPEGSLANATSSVSDKSIPQNQDLPTGKSDISEKFDLLKHIEESKNLNPPSPVHGEGICF